MLLKEVWSSLGKLPAHLPLRDGVDKADREWDRAFEIADTAEKGLAREVATDFLQPLRKSSKLWRFRVVRSEDRMHFRLLDDSGQFLMHARVCLEARRVEFFLYDLDKTRGALSHSLRPVFSMAYSEDASEWLLVQEQCELCRFSHRHLTCACRGRQQVLHVQHSRRRPEMGETAYNVMDAYIPGLYSDGSRVVWCPLQERGDLADVDEGSSEVQRLTSRPPVWNEEIRSLVLDFKGRNVISSAKNFQLTLQQKPGHVICQFGRLGPSSYALDLRYPLSLVQGFGMSISTLFWM